LRILTVSNWFPFPPNNGARTRTFHLLREIGRRHVLDLAAIYQSESDLEHLDEVRAFCRRVAAFPSHDFQPESMARWKTFLSGEPRSFAARFSPDLQRTSIRWSGEEDYDAVVAISLGSAPYAADLDIPFKVLDQHNVESRVLKRQWENERGAGRKFRFAPTWIKAQRYERRLAEKFDLISLVSDDEMALMKRLIGKSGGQQFMVAPNGVDAGLLDYPRSVKDPDVVLFSGAVTYRPNYEAVRWLCNEIMPRVRMKLPSVRLRVTGGYGGVDVSAFGTNVEFTGYVDDIRPVVASASVLATPITSGGGTRVKILEAMALGTPVVSTTFGAEGLHLRNGIDVLLGDTTEKISESIIKIIQDGGLSAEIARAAEATVGSRFRWTEIAENFEQAIVAYSKRRLR